MSISPKYYSISKEAVISSLGSSMESGLKRKDIGKLHEKYGSNQISYKNTTSGWRILLKQINNPLTYLLLGVVIVSALTDHIIDAYIVGFLAFVNVAVGFFLEFSALQKSESIKKLVRNRCLIIRDGSESVIETKDLVPGDIVLLSEGDSIPADLRLLEGFNLTVDESALTGESLPIAKNSNKVKERTVLAERTSMLYTGTSVVSGKGKGVVTAIGDHTELGKISQSLTEVKEERSLFHERTEKLLRTMIIFSLITASISLTILVIRGEGMFEIFEFTIATLVSGIPEGLPSVLTVLLSLAAVRMARKKALLKNIPSIETLASVDVIVTDKTGTLTQNKISVAEIYYKDKVIDIDQGDISKPLHLISEFKDLHDIGKLLDFLALSTDCEIIEKKDGYDFSGSPTEIARYLIPFRSNVKRSDLLQKYTILDLIPYSQETKYSLYLVKNRESNEKTLIIVGGSDRVLDLVHNSEKPSQYSDEKTNQGYRVQAIGYKSVSEESISNYKIAGFEHLATLSMSDPIREDVPDTIKRTLDAGIRVVMATGDSKNTAFAIAKEAGIIPKDSSNINDYVLGQEDVDGMSNTQFTEAIKNYDLFARVTPETKIRIASTLKDIGSVVAMTGDGVNDAPALKNADIGVSMGMNGTDVAREASDIILLDDAFSTIYEAIKEGRTVFANIRRTSVYLVTTNLAEDLLIIVSLLMGLALPLLPIQILWLNLVTDGINDVALASEPSRESIMKDRPIASSTRILGRRDFIQLIVTSVTMGIVSLLVYLYYLDISLEYARSMVFIVMVTLQVFNAYVLRSTKISVFKLDPKGNKFLLISMLISMILLVLSIYWEPLSNLLSTIKVDNKDFLVGGFLGLSVVLVSELYKKRIRIRVQFN